HQVLADGEHVDVVRAQVAHDLQDFLVGFAQADHDAGLGRNFRVQGLEALEQVERVGVVGTGPGFLVQARDGFQVVVHDVRRGGLEDFQGAVHAAAEVRGQDLDAGGGRERAHALDAGG